MKCWEINGNLDDKQTGLQNYQMFEDGVCKVKKIYDKIFGIDVMNRIPFYVDNATANSGYTPISTPVLQKIVIIKLNISSKDGESKIIYQFTHELTHVVFRAYFGMDKPRANDKEEALCTAAALMVIKMLCPNDFEFYEDYTANLEYCGYRNGVLLAKTLEYDMEYLRNEIEKYRYE